MSVLPVAQSLGALADTGQTFAMVELNLAALGGSFDQYRKALQRLYLCLWRATDFGKNEVRLTDRELAKLCGRSLRWVQKALRQGLGIGSVLGRDAAEPCEPRLIKEFVKGPRDKAGRVLGINLRFVPAKSDRVASEPVGRSQRGQPRRKAPPSPSAAPSAPKPPAAALSPQPPAKPGALRKAFAAGAGLVLPPSRPASSTVDPAQRRAELDAQFEELRRRREAHSPDPKPRE